MEGKIRSTRHARHALVASIETFDDHDFHPHPGLAYAYVRIMRSRTRRRLLSTFFLEEKKYLIISC